MDPFARKYLFQNMKPLQVAIIGSGVNSTKTSRYSFILQQKKQFLIQMIIFFYKGFV
jgi:hypothetical protein